jgi:hypothetical protein
MRSRYEKVPTNYTLLAAANPVRKLRIGCVLNENLSKERKQHVYGDLATEIFRRKVAI